MSWLWIALGAWIIVALGAAVLIGRSIRRADREELGSTLDWDPSGLESQDAPHPRD
ncbi:hypothetical protein M2284_001469 [Rhodococcus sp. LBL1]|uniref:Uncharacterized protein n=1 Tax=Prescottella agglutinans TaxID=1644129 RepID=A0ABT6M9B8_9NOCA|nr:hypothetical protein [Prescottella agglutinans]MDH6280475.1 hypothetical protein [Prescottella agglutinans]MDH6677271.1 hypothetical protein [Rhodococcus sp. LBL1]MDH6682436.1 hypothetical protein [Rhodococcus sp. LBL2]